MIKIGNVLSFDTGFRALWLNPGFEHEFLVIWQCFSQSKDLSIVKL